MSRVKSQLVPSGCLPYSNQTMPPTRSIPIEGIAFGLSVESGPIVADGCSHASYADMGRRLIRVNGQLTSHERMWAACLAVALAADRLHASHLLDPVMIANAAG
jgi:hypothetical protein